MVNEKYTENIVRKHFEGDNKYSEIILEEQKSKNPRINKLLAMASKRGKGVGKPEFIISFKNQNLKDFLIIVECKADILKHESKNKDKYGDYAVDGVLLYSSYLSPDFDVLSIAVSGEDIKNIKVSHFIQNKGKKEAKNEFGDILLSIDDYIKPLIIQTKPSINIEKLNKYKKTLNNYLQTIQVKESQRSLLFSGILIALGDAGFKKGYDGHKKPAYLAEFLVNTIKNRLSDSINNPSKSENLIEAYNFIKTHPALSQQDNILNNLIEDIDKNINSYEESLQFHDFLGQFYIEFLQYANSDKGLGIVLTPPHITELFSEIAGVNKDSIILDNCTGTGGFPISAMGKMIKDAKNDNKKIKEIYTKQIIGIEFQPDIYALLCSNMFIHGDGKSSMIHGSCFDEKIIEEIKSRKLKPNVGFLNPPYKSEKGDKYEFEFILNNANMLEKGSKCIAIIPMSCVLATSGKELEFKKEILSKHTLEAVFSMPDELFINSDVSTITGIIVLTTGIPHREKHETYFGYWKDDGFSKRKTAGRQDYNNKWDDIKNRWIYNYINKKIVDGESVMKYVTAEDEWCAEAYMETDYSKITKEDFIKSAKDYTIFSFANNLINDASNKSILQENINLNIYQWKYFTIDKLFKVEKMKGNISIQNDKNTNGKSFLLSSIDSNNGVTGKTYKEPHEGNVLTYNNNGSIGVSYYQPLPFCATGDVSILNPLFKLNKYIGLFLVSILNTEKYRYNFGRKANGERLSKIKIKLPPKSDGTPDFEFMENYIKSLPYSSSL